MCRHSQWFDLQGAGQNWLLIDHSRFGKLIADLARPQDQYPCLVFFLGKTLKTRILSRMFSQNNITRCQPHRVGNLYVDNNALDADFPIIFADSTAGPSPAFSTRLPTDCQEDQVHKVHVRESTTYDDLRMKLYTNLIFPSCYTVCIFADDLGGNQRYVEFIRNLLKRQIWCLDHENRVFPRLLTIISHRDHIDSLFQLECLTSFHLLFQSHTIVSIENKADAILRDSDFIKRSLLVELDKAREQRRHQYLLFNAVNMAQNILQLTKAFAHCPEKATDVMDGRHHPTYRVMDGIQRHVKLFLDLPVTKELGKEVLADYIATALLLNAYVESHHRFHPTRIFDTFFSHLNAVQESPIDGLQQAIRERFTLAFEKLETNTALEIRHESFAFASMPWDRFKINSTCLLCLARPPEYVLLCGHKLCEECIQEYGIRLVSVYTYFVKECLLCQSDAGLTVSCKPPTTEPSLLSVDGGGIRGIVALKLLQRLEECLSTQNAVWEYFDYIVGTSVGMCGSVSRVLQLTIPGGFIVLDLVICRSSIHSSVVRFLDLAPRIFEQPESVCSMFLCKLITSLRWWFTDSKYESEILDDVLQEVFGINQKLFGYRTPAHPGTKIGITSTTAEDCDLRLFTDYSGPSPEKQCGYGLLRPADSCEEPCVWEVARCTSAAPGYFTPKNIPSFGPLQDGGLRANNPTELGLLEIRRIWPRTQNPSIVLSVGTGYSSSPTHRVGASLVSKPSIWHDGFIPRLIKGFLSSPCLHGQNSWVALVHRIENERRPDFFRLNYEFVGREPALDDIKQLSRLDELVAQQKQTDLVPYRNALWSSRFFLEFTNLPEWVEGRYLARGSIFCRFRDARPLLRAITDQYPQWHFAQEQQKVQSAWQCCDNCGHFQAEILIEARRLDTPFHVEIVYDDVNHRRVPGTPNSMTWFTSRQSRSGTWRAWTVTSCCGGFRQADGQRLSKRRRVS